MRKQITLLLLILNLTTQIQPNYEFSPNKHTALGVSIAALSIPSGIATLYCLKKVHDLRQASDKASKTLRRIYIFLTAAFFGTSSACLIGGTSYGTIKSFRKKVIPEPNPEKNDSDSIIKSILDEIVNTIAREDAGTNYEREEKSKSDEEFLDCKTPTKVDLFLSILESPENEEYLPDAFNAVTTALDEQTDAIKNAIKLAAKNDFSKAFELETDANQAVKLFYLAENANPQPETFGIYKAKTEAANKFQETMKLAMQTYSENADITYWGKAKTALELVKRPNAILKAKVLKNSVTAIIDQHTSKKDY